jgi:N-acetylglutamate synthase-like GNAT family acetyltransferase
LLAEDAGGIVATVAMSFLRMTIGGEELTVGMPMRVATDEAYRGRGIFREMEAENEEHARASGVRLLLTVPNAASAPVFLERLGWTPLRSLRVWARIRALPARRARARVERFDDLNSRPAEPSGDRVLRDAAWLNWRFADAPRRYTLLRDGGGYAVVGSRGPFGVVAVLEGRLLRTATVTSSGRALIAAPPPWDVRRYLVCGYVPTHRTFTVLGKSLDPTLPLPERPHFQLGDLDIF